MLSLGSGRIRSAAMGVHITGALDVSRRLVKNM